MDNNIGNEAFPTGTFPTGNEKIEVDLKEELEKEIILKPVESYGKVKFNLENLNLTGNEEKLVLDMSSLGESYEIKQIEINLKKYEGELSGYFLIEEEDLSISLVDKDGGIILKKNIADCIELIGDQKEYLDTKLYSSDKKEKK